jgi:hypothetical protein
MNRIKNFRYSTEGMSNKQESQSKRQLLSVEFISVGFTLPLGISIPFVCEVVLPTFCRPQSTCRLQMLSQMLPEMSGVPVP